MQPQERVSNQVVNLPPMGPQLSAEQISQKSLTHWVHTPYQNISNMMPWGLKSDLGYREQRWTVLERCVPYPLGNLTSTAVDRKEMGELHESGYTLAPTQVITKELVKYAQEQAQELGESYAPEGLRVLVPLTGMDDRELVGQIIQVVQPFAYDLHEMPYEFTEGAKKRIAESNLNDGDRKKATATAVIMLHGAQAATGAANARYEELISLMSDAQVGKPGISNPNDFYKWICRQLNKEVPERINRTQAGSNNKAIDILAQRALREETTYEAMSRVLEAERAARRDLEQRLLALENKAPKAKLT